MEVRDLVMQRQPTPQHDPLQKGQFLCHEQALKEAKLTLADLTDISILPLTKLEGKKKKASDAKTRDTTVSNAIGLKSWDAKKVHCFLVCYHCGKRRCIYCLTEATYIAAFQHCSAKAGVCIKPVLLWRSSI